MKLTSSIIENIINVRFTKPDNSIHEIDETHQDVVVKFFGNEEKLNEVMNSLELLINLINNGNYIPKNNTDPFVGLDSKGFITLELLKNGVVDDVKPNEYWKIKVMEVKVINILYPIPYFL